jgi:opacity protein-like surface antigen
MKKLIAIAVVFVLAVGAAFAADVSAEVIGMTNILTGDSTKDSPVNAGQWPGGFKRARVNGSGENDEGTFGAWFRFETYGRGAPDLFGYAWWKPIDQIQLTVGTNPDGFNSKDGSAPRWGFYQVGGDVGVPVEMWRFNASFYSGWGDNGAMLTVKPTEDLEIWFAIPFNNYFDNATKFYAKMSAQASYNLGSMGSVALTYVGDLNDDPLDVSFEDDPWVLKKAGNGSTLYGYFGLRAIENLDIDFGVAYTLPVKADVDTGAARLQQITAKTPLAVGLGVKFAAGPLGIKARVQGRFAGSIDTPTTSTKLPTYFTADLMPFFEVTDKVTVHLSTGMDMAKPDGEDSTVGWHIEPYVTVKASWWAPNFYAGVRFATDGQLYEENKSTLTWSIPIGIAFAF